MNSKKIKVVTVVGTRPEIIRLSETIKELDVHTEHILVHTGQNYDYELSEVFFEQLGIPKPDYFLEAAQDTPAKTVGEVMSKVDDVLETENPDAVLVLGDTNSCLAAYSAKRRKIPIFHLEAGNRCFDMRVPEEINRRLIDHLSDMNLVYSDLARLNLIREGLPTDRIIKTGSPLFEVLQRHGSNINSSNVLKDLGLSQNEYFLVSVHREENTSTTSRMSEVIKTLQEIEGEYKLPVIVTTHPRTRKQIEKMDINLSENIKLLKPFGFFDYIKLQKNAFCTISDSGTINEEAAMLNFPAVNLRESHERPEAMDEATCVMSGIRSDRVLQAINLTVKQYDSSCNQIPEGYESPKVSKKVTRIILSYVDYINRVNGWQE